MQSKLPVRIKRKQALADKKKCCCIQLLKIMIDNPVDCNDFSVQTGLSNEDLSKGTKKVRTRSTQTEMHEIGLETDKPYIEIKTLLLSINCTLQHILHSLQDRKEYLYNKLQEESTAPCKKTKVYYNKNKIEKVKKKNFQLSKKFTYAWPEISRQYYGQQYWLKNYMQKSGYDLPPSGSNYIICPKPQSWVCASRPYSCSDINYFQPMGRILERRPFGLSICANPIFTLIGQGDLNLSNDNDIYDLNDRKSTKGTYVQSINKEVQ